jgi:hypothetical protein
MDCWQRHHAAQAHRAAPVAEAALSACSAAIGSRMG